MAIPTRMQRRPRHACKPHHVSRSRIARQMVRRNVSQTKVEAHAKCPSNRPKLSSFKRLPRSVSAGRDRHHQQRIREMHAGRGRRNQCDRHCGRTIKRPSLELDRLQLQGDGKVFYTDSDGWDYRRMHFAPNPLNPNL